MRFPDAMACLAIFREAELHAVNLKAFLQHVQLAVRAQEKKRNGISTSLLYSVIICCMLLYRINKKKYLN